MSTDPHTILTQKLERARARGSAVVLSQALAAALLEEPEPEEPPAPDPSLADRLGDGEPYKVEDGVAYVRYRMPGWTGAVVRPAQSGEVLTDLRRLASGGAHAMADHIWSQLPLEVRAEHVHELVTQAPEWAERHGLTSEMRYARREDLTEAHDD